MLIKIYGFMKKHKESKYRTIEEAISSADRNWEVVKQRFSRGECDKEELVWAMNLCNSIESSLIKKREAIYLSARKEFLVDRDKSIGDSWLDNHFDDLRMQVENLL